MRSPAFPRRIFTNVQTDNDAVLASYRNELLEVEAVSQISLLAQILFGSAVTALHSVSFGLDSIKDKGIKADDTFRQDRVARVAEDSESHLAGMTDSIIPASA